MCDVVALGEILIDLAAVGTDERGGRLYVRNAGGAPANVLAMLALLGHRTQFIGKVGRDSFGEFLKYTLEGCGVGCRGLVFGQEPTTLAFVHLDKTGERSFSFYRDHSADVALTREEIDMSLLEKCRVFHFGSVSLSDEPARDATLYAVQRAKAAGKLISYDPNYRPAIWCGKEEQAAEILRRGLALADIVKVSDEEAELLTGERDCARAANCLAQGGVKYAFVTAGNRGCWYAAGGHSGYVPAFSVETVDTTGAGDSFMGAALHCLLSLPEEELLRPGAEMLEKTVRFASAAGALCTTGYGSIASMPGERQIRQLLDAKS